MYQSDNSKYSSSLCNDRSMTRNRRSIRVFRFHFSSFTIESHFFLSALLCISIVYHAFLPRDAYKITFTSQFKQISSNWPPLRIYYYKLNDYYNNDLIKLFKTSNRTISNQIRPYLLEREFPELLYQTPLLTKEIVNADIVYFNYFLTFDILATKVNRLKKKCISSDFRKIIRKMDLPDSKILLIQSWPATSRQKCIDAGDMLYFGTSERRKDYENDFVLPYYTNYQHYTVENHRTSNVDKIYSIIFIDDAKKPRNDVTEAMKAIKNSKIVSEPKDEEEIDHFNLQIPHYFANSTFSLITKNNVLSTRYIYDSVLYDCIPILLNSRFELPFAGTLVNWDEITIKISESDLSRLPDILNSVNESKIQDYRMKLRKAGERLRFDNGIKYDNGVGSILWDIYLRYFSRPKIDASVNKTVIDPIKNVKSVFLPCFMSFIVLMSISVLVVQAFS